MHILSSPLINHPFQLKSNRDAYDGYVPMAYDEYLEKVARSVAHPAEPFFFLTMEPHVHGCLISVLLHNKLTETVNGVTM